MDPIKQQYWERKKIAESIDSSTKLFNKVLKNVPHSKKFGKIMQENVIVRNSRRRKKNNKKNKTLA